MSDAKKAVMKMINKKKKRIQEHRARKFSGPYSVIHEFINRMDDVLEASNTEEAFAIDLQSAVHTLHNRMKQIDPEIELLIQWSKSEDWSNMRVEGIEITWSSFYLGKNPFKEKTQYIDIGQLFLEGYFDDKN